MRQALLPASPANYESHVAGPCPLTAQALGDLFVRFRQLRDPRTRHGLYYRKAHVLACATLSTRMGARIIPALLAWARDAVVGGDKELPPFRAMPEEVK